MAIIITIFYLAFVVFNIVAYWKTFEKAGQPGWACLIPFYNFYIMLKMAGKPGWWLLLLLIPLVNLIIVIIVYNEIAKGFGRGTGMVIAMIFIFGWWILGYGDATWKNQIELQNPDILHS